MKKHVGLMSLFAFVLTLGFPAFAQEVHGVFRVVKGTVKVKSAQNGQESRARLGAKVLPGDMIITEKDSRAKVVMVDNNEINVSPESQITIEKYVFDPAAGKKDVLLNVIYGKVRSKVEQKYDGKTSKFQVKTPSAVAGVRGTDFMAGYTAATGVSQVITFEGKVEFGLPGAGGQILNPVSVVPGQMAEMSKGGAPAAPTEVPKDNLQQMDRETNAETGGATSASTSPTTAPTDSQSGDKQAPKDEKSASAEKKPETKSNGSDDRKPSSTSSSGGGGSMVQESDLPRAPSSNTPVPKPMANTLPINAVPVLDPNRTCDTCVRRNEGGNGKTLLNVNVRQ